MRRYFFVSFFILLFIVSSTNFAYADDLALTGSNSFSGTVSVAMPITDLQISGTTPSTTPVKLRVTSGTLAMSTTTGLTFTGSPTGSTLYFSGTLANINAALATLTYTRGSTGTDTLEVSLVNSGEVFFSENNHLYKFISGSITWNGAQAAAPSQTAYGVNGYLATITSQSENDFVAARLVGDGWFGASDSAIEGNWRWVTGPESGTQFWSGAGGGSTVGGNYANWASGEPNDSSGNEDCAQFYISTGKWNDLPCSGSNLAGYVAEFGTPGNLPTVIAKNISITTGTNPTVSTFSPVDNATNVNPNSNLVLTFSTAVTVNSGDILIKKTSDDSTIETIDVTGLKVTGSGTSTITINPATTLVDLTGYYVTIPGTAFKDGSNNFYAGISLGTTWNFTTGDFTPPTVPGTPSTPSPTNDTTPTWTWSESTDSGSGLERYLLKWAQTPDCYDYTTTTGPSGTYTPPGGIFTAGTWYFCVAARDNAQNDSAYSAAGSVVIDLTAPVLTQVAPVAAPVYVDTSPFYSFSTTESGTYTISTCGGTSQPIADEGSGKVTFTTLVLNQTYSCTFYSTDAAGNQSNTLTIGPFVAVSRPYHSSGYKIPNYKPVVTNTLPATTPLVTLPVIPSKYPFYPTLRYGNKKEDVRKLQQFLNAHDAVLATDGAGAPGKETDLFSMRTFNAVKTYQKMKNITRIDGVVGPITHAVMMKDLGL